MADNESSHLMWIIIVLAVAVMIFTGLKLAFPGVLTQITDRFSASMYYIPNNNVISDPTLKNSNLDGTFSNESKFEKIKSGSLYDSRPANVSNIYKVTAKMQWAYFNKWVGDLKLDANQFVGKTLTISAWVNTPDKFMPNLVGGYYDVNETGSYWVYGSQRQVKIVEQHGDWKYVSSTFKVADLKKQSITFVIGFSGIAEGDYNTANFYIGGVKLEDSDRATIFS